MSNALILLQAKAIRKDLKEIELIKVIQFDNDTSVKRKGKVRKIHSFEHLELLLSSISEFKDICKLTRLHLETEPEKIHKFQIHSFEHLKLLLSSISEFKDICKLTRLHLETEPEKIHKFREMLQDPVCEA
jgi:hypothetical protein